MILERRAGARGVTRTGWLDSRHAFSFGQYHDPAWMGFGALRVLNEDRVAPGGGFPMHGHANMEIFSYVLDGALAHRDDAGADGGVLGPGELQWMGAGHGIRHSEGNASGDAPVHFLQAWIQPDRVNARPGWARNRVPAEERAGRWADLASPDGAGGSLAMRQQAWLRGSLLAPGAGVAHALAPDRRYWLHVARGAVVAGGTRLSAGDALAYAGEGGELLVRGDGEGVADVLLFDLPG